jgi:hypothetical protein
MFPSILRRIAPLAIAVAALTACQPDLPVAPAGAVTAQLSALSATPTRAQISRADATVPFSFVVYTSCANNGNGEVLQANGELQYRGQWSTINDGQRHHDVVVERFVGSATGWETGETYDIATREHTQGNIAEGTDGIQDSGEDLTRIQMRLTSRATGLVIDIVLTSHFVETPNGDWVLDGWDAKSHCR